MTTIPTTSMILAEAEEGRPRVSRQWFGRTNTIEYHDFFARQFAIFSASKGDDFDGIVRQGDVCPGGMNIVAASLKHWHQALRKGEYNGIDGIDSVKRAVVAAGGTMDALERRVELSELPDFFQKYKEMKGDSFDGTVHQKDDFPGFESCNFLYRWLENIYTGQCDGQDGIVQVKAAAREMGYLITDEDFLGMLQNYVAAEGRSGRIKKNATIEGVNSGKMFGYVKKIRSGSDADLKERVDEILGPHPNDREALDALSETLRGRIHSIAAYDGYSSPTPSDMSISDGEDGDEQQEGVSDLRLMRTVTPRGSSDDDSSGAMDIQPSAQAQCNIFTRTSGPSLVSGRVMPGPSSARIIRPNTKQWLMECVAVAAVGAKAETQPQREGSSIASPQQRKKRKQAKSADLADWFEAS